MQSSVNWVMILGVAAVAGCGRSGEPAQPQSPKPAPATARPASLFRFHFLGTTRLAADTNAAPWVSMAALPASEALWRQTLEKLSRAPYQFSRNRMATTNDYAGTFQELVADCVRAESLVGVTGDTNRIAECELAVRLPPGRAEFWRTNLLAILESWTGCRGESLPLPGGATGGRAPMPAGWQLKKHHDPNLFRLVRAGDWTLIGCGQDQLPLQNEYERRIAQAGSPIAPSDPLLGGSGGGSWLGIFLDCPNLPSLSLGPVAAGVSPLTLTATEIGGDSRRLLQTTQSTGSPPATLNAQPGLKALPAVRLSVTGRDSNLRLEGDFAFRDPFSWKPEAWQIPTNLIRDPIISFTAVQGISSELKKNQAAYGLRMDSFPNQLFVWSGAAFPVQTLAAAPINNAEGYLGSLAPQLIARWNPQLQARSAGSLTLTTNAAGNATLRWLDIPPFVVPYITMAHDAGSEFLLAGIYPLWGLTNPSPPVLFQYLSARTNVVYYNWELTGERTWAWRNVVNIFRHFFEKPRLGPDAASIVWINSVSNRLGNTITEVTRSDSNRLSLVRQGPVGLTGLELIALAHWLESTNFPLNGLTFAARTNRVTGDK
jgi:hypothetical protein